MIALAHGFDLLTTPYVFNPDEAVAMTKAGADIIVAHMGVTDRRLDRRHLGEDAGRMRRSRSTRSPRRRLRVRKDVIVLCHGGPIAMPADAEYILQNCRALPRLLRRVEHGAAAGGERADGADAEVQGDRDRRGLKRRAAKRKRAGGRRWAASS